MKSSKKQYYYTKFVASFLAAVFFVTLVGCQEKPGDVALKFVTAMNNADFETAKNCVNDEAAEVLDKLAPFIKSRPDFAEKLAENRKKNFYVHSTDVEGDRATVVLKDRNGSLSEESVRLMLIGKNWKVALMAPKSPELPNLED